MNLTVRSKPTLILQSNTISFHYLPADTAANRNRITNENFIAPQIHNVEMWLKKKKPSEFVRDSAHFLKCNE